MKNFEHMSLITAQNQYKTSIKPLLALLCMILGVVNVWGTVPFSDTTFWGHFRSFWTLMKISVFGTFSFI